jgi:hypothetical protein
MLKFRTQKLSRKRDTSRIQPSLEGLEHRVVPSTFKVNTMLDTVAVNLHNGKDAYGLDVSGAYQ